MSRSADGMTNGTQWPGNYWDFVDGLGLVILGQADLSAVPPAHGAYLPYDSYHVQL